MSGDKTYLRQTIANGEPLKIVGIIRASENAVASMMSGSLAYTSALTDYILEKTASAEALQEQMANPDTDIFTGLRFASDEDEEFRHCNSHVFGYGTTVYQPNLCIRSFMFACFL